MGGTEHAASVADPTRARRFHPLRVVDVVDETADTRTLVFDVPDQLSPTFTYQPGQFCTVRVTIDGDEVSRCYSMSSAPATDERLAVTVKRVPGGLVSNWLNDRVAVGDELDLMPPSGMFCAADDTRPVLAFAGGSGITPIFSIVKQLLATTGRRVRLLDANRDADSVIFHDHLERLARDHAARFGVRHHLDDSAGYLTIDDVTAFVGDDAHADVFICGPTAFMDLVECGVATAGVTPDRIAIERFDTSAAPEPTSAERADDGPQEAAEPEPTERLTIKIKRKRHEIDYVVGDTILEAARRGGLAPPFSCEQGNCATCMALVTGGEVEMRANNVLSDDELAEGWVLTCQGLPVGREVAVEYEDL